MAGYSGTPLARMLGIKEGHSIALLSAPDGFETQLAGLPDDVTIRAVSRGTNDVLVSFHTRRADFEKKLGSRLRSMDVDGGLWVAWPKRASGVATDMTEDVLREVCLPIGLVDNKVCAIDDTWSGLRVVWRRELRDAKRAARSR